MGLVNMENKYFECLYEDNWYDVAKIDYEYEIVHIKTENGKSRIHMCYIDEIREK